MANTLSIVTVEDGPRNVIIKLTGVLDTSDVSVATLIDPASLSVIGAREGAATRLALCKVNYSIEDALSVYLYWDATTDVLIAPLQGRGKLCFKTPINNTEASGVTGIVNYATQGYASGTLSYVLELTFKKYIK